MLEIKASWHRISLVNASVFVLFTVLLGACSGSSSISDPPPVSEPTFRLTTSFKGDDLALSVVDVVDEMATENDSIPTQLRLRSVADVIEQSWKFTKLDDGRFTIGNQSIGDGYSIDVVNDGVLDRIHMAPTADVSGQYWTITLKSNGYCQFTNSFTGSEIALDIRVEGDQDEPKLAPVGDFSGQSWRITPNSTTDNIDEDLLACAEI